MLTTGKSFYVVCHSSIHNSPPAQTSTANFSPERTGEAQSLFIFSLNRDNVYRIYELMCRTKAGERENNSDTLIFIVLIFLRLSPDTDSTLGAFL